MVRRHWPFWVLAGAGLALRICATIAYRPALVYIDSVRYLGGDERGLDPLGYSFLLLRPLLAVHAGLTGVAITQHALGLAMGAFTYALLRRYGAPCWLAAVAAAPVLLDAYQIQAEQMIMPDAAFETLIVVAIAILLWPSGRRVPGLARLVAAAAVLGVSATVRQVGELLLLPLLAYALACAGPGHPDGPGWRGSVTRCVLRRVLRCAVTVVVFALPVIGYMTLSATVLGTGFRLSDLDDSYLYARVAYAADCATLRIPGYERPLCPAPATSALLGVDGLATGASSPLYQYAAPPSVNRGTAIADFDRAVLTQQPERVAGDIAGDAIKLFALTRDTAPGDPPISRWQFQVTYPVYRSADEAILGPSVPRAVAPLATALRAYQVDGGFTPGPLLLTFLILGTSACVSRRAPRSLKMACLLATSLAVTALLGADLYEFSWRYQLPALVTLPLAGAFGALAVGRGAAIRRSGSNGRMMRCTLNRLSLRYGPSPAASSTQIHGSGSARTRSNAATDPAEHTPSSNGTTSP
jgi:hypothetical protein